MGKSGKQKRLYDMYMDEIADFEDDLLYFNNLKTQLNQQNQNNKQNQQSPHTYNTRSHMSSHLSKSSSVNQQNFNKPKMLTHMMTPRNSVQDAYIKQINNENTSIVLATGPAGTGKSCIAVSAAIELFNKGKYERIVITRPAVTVDEEHGFLPGKIEDKLDPWVRPLYDTFYKYFSPDTVKSMIANKTIDICPLAYLRGRTLENSFIIVDEAQNCSVKQMLMTMTRIGDGSKMIITGDPSQHDRGYEKSGLTDLIERLYRKINQKNQNIEISENNEDMQVDSQVHVTNTSTSANSINGIAHIRFTSEHIERHPIIKQVLSLYE